MPPFHIQEEMRKEFHEVLGMAISRWQFIEMAVFCNFHFLLETPFETSSTVFYHIRSSDSKLQLTDKLMRRRQSPSVVARWKPIHKNLLNNLIIRNNLAHFEAGFAWKPAVLGELKWEVIMSPSHLDIGSIRPEGVPAMNVAKLLEISAVYLEGCRTLIVFAKQCFPDWQQHIASLPPLLRQLLEIDLTATTDVATRQRLESLMP